jgi:kynurenine formamidase
VEIIDISVPIRSGMTVYEGDPAVRLGKSAELAKGHIA